MMTHVYFKKVKEILNLIEEKEINNIQQGAKKIADSIQRGGVVHVFGCGHSHMLSEEVYYRAGGLVPIHPIFQEPLMLHEGAMHSSELEKKTDYAKSFMEEQDIRENDVMMVISTSGRNPVPIDTVILAKEKGAYVIGISSHSYKENYTSRHESGKFLYEVVDVAIDNHIPVGDALLTDEHVKVNFASGSTVAGATIMNVIMAEAIAIMVKNGFEPPVLLSGNVDGSDQHNKALIEKYRNRVSF